MMYDFFARKPMTRSCCADVLLRVFDQLQPVPSLFRIRRVCRRWRALLTATTSAHLYAELDFAASHKLSVEAGLAAVHLAGPCLRRLALPPSARRAWAEVLLAAAARCPATRALRLENLEAVGDDAVAALARGCPQLRELNVRGCRNVGDASLLALAEAAPPLEVLVADQAASPLTDRSVARLAAACGPSLLCLDLGGAAALTDAAAAAIASGCPRLETLSLRRAALTDAGVFALAGGCRALRSVSLRQCRHVSAAGAERLARELATRLTALDLSGLPLSPPALAALAACTALHSLSLFRCAGVPEGPWAAAWPALEQLELGGAAGLTDAALETLPAACPRLASLDLRGCRLLSDAAILRAAERLPGLRALDLGGCSASEAARAQLRARGIFVEALRYTV